MPQPWEVIREWLESHCPAEAARLRPPASEAELRAAEDEVGASLPSDLGGWWRTADGVTDGSWLMPAGFAPYSVAAALSSRRAWIGASEDGGLIARHADEPAGTSCDGVWLPRWLPVAGSGGGDDIFVDLRPGPAFGCVGEFRHDSWDYRGPRWPSVTAMLAETADVLTTGRSVRGFRPRVADGGRFDWELVPVRRRVGPTGGIRVTEVTPEEAGIRPAVGGGLPAYVPRDLDSRLRALIAGAAESGGFVLVVGAPLAGKTRTLYEAVVAVLPGWELVPTRNDQLLAINTRAGHRRQIMWMDDIRADRFGGGLLVDSLRRPGAVVVGTCLPEQWAILAPPSLADHEHAARETGPEHALAGRSPERIRVDEVTALEALTTVLELPSDLSPAEHAAAAAAEDDQIRDALADPGGLVPAIAGGPATVRRWEAANDRSDWAFVTAAADALRVGCRTLSRELLSAAAPAYGEETTRSDGAGYVMGHYLYEHIRRARETVPLPGRAWSALVEHHDPSDSFTLAAGAVAAGRPEHAVAIYRRLLEAAADPDDIPNRARGTRALMALLPVLDDADRVDDAIATMDRYGDLARGDTARRFADLLARHGRVEELRVRADSGDWHAAAHLKSLRARTDDLGELRERAANGDHEALFAVVRRLAEDGRSGEATAFVRELAAAGDPLAIALVDEGGNGSDPAG
jgi:cell wall assembly regulator SMI1